MSRLERLWCSRIKSLAKLVREALKLIEIGIEPWNPSKIYYPHERFPDDKDSQIRERLLLKIHEDCLDLI